MNFYRLNKDEVLENLDSNMEGLTSKEVKNRIAKYGLNVLPKKKNDSIFKIFFSQMCDPIVILLIITVIFSFIINEVVDAFAIIFIIVVDLILGTFEEWKASKDAEALASLIKVKAKVLRDSKEIEIDSSQLVIGDIVLIESGNQISADLRILESHNLQIDESILTGESVNVVKNADTIIDKSNYLIKNPSQYKNNYAKLFGNNNPICLELGMGRGSFIIQMAKAHPNINYIGLEIDSSQTATAVQNCGKENIQNLKMISKQYNHSYEQKVHHIL